MGNKVLYVSHINLPERGEKGQLCRKSRHLANEHNDTKSTTSTCK
jgi:hypothetical protein